MMTAFELGATLGLDISEFKKGLDKAKGMGEGFEKTGAGIRGATQKMSGGFTILKGAISNVIGSGVNALAGALQQNLGSAISRTDTLNNYAIVMQNLGHSATDAKAEINRLADGIDGLPTTLDSIASTQQQFTALGMSMKDATNLSLALNNATLAGGQGQAKANSAMQQWYQMIAAGKSDLMSMRIINEAMPAQMDAIAKSVIGADANWQDLHNTWKEDPSLTGKVQEAILKLNEEGINGTASFAEQAETATQGIGTSMQNLQSAVQRGIANVLDTIGQENIAEAFNNVKETINGAFGGVVDFVETIKNEGLDTAISEVIQNMGNAFNGLGETINMAFEKIDIGAVVQSMIERMTQFLLVVPARIGELFNTIDWGSIWESLKSGIAEAGPQMLEVLGNVLNDLALWLSENGAEAIVALGEGFIEALPTLISFAGKVVNAILKVIVGLPAKLLAMGLSAIGKFALGLLKGVNSATKAIGKIIKAIVNTAGDKIKDFLNVGKNIVQGIWKGISGGYDWIKNKISGWVGNVVEWVKDKLGIKSPSKVMAREVGKWIPAGIAQGILSNSDLIDDAMDDVIPTDFDGITSNGIEVTTKPIGEGNKVFGDAGKVVNVYNNITVDGTENPEEFAERFARQLKMSVRTA